MANETPTTGRRIVMNDGTVLENSEIGYVAGSIWCMIKNKTIVEAVVLFSDSTKTSHLVFQYGEMEDVYDGFVVLRAATVSDDGISIGLQKEV